MEYSETKGRYSQVTGGAPALQTYPTDFFCSFRSGCVLVSIKDRAYIHPFDSEA